MPEDAQPNDLRGRNTAKGIPTVRSARNVPQSRDFPFPPPASFKRPSDRSYPASPAKRRRLDRIDEPARKKIRRELPPACRKGAPGCHRERKQFVAQEIEGLQRTEFGLKVLNYNFTEGAVIFICTQPETVHYSLAPTPVNVIQPTEASRPKVEPPPQNLPLPPTIVSIIPGPPRIFKSGTLSFSVDLPITGEEQAVVDRTSAAFGTRLDHPIPVAEPTFGKQGLPKSSSSIAVASAPVPPIRRTSVFNSGSRIVQSVSQATAVDAVAGGQRVADPTSGAVDLDLDDPRPVAELMFGKQGLPKLPSSIADSSVSLPSKNHSSLFSSGSRIVKPVLQAQATASQTVVGGERVIDRAPSALDAGLDDPITVAELMFGKQGPPKPSSSITAGSLFGPVPNSRGLIGNPIPQTQGTAFDTVAGGQRVVNHTSGAIDGDLDDPRPVAELMFGKQGPTQPSSSAVGASLPSKTKSFQTQVIVSDATTPSLPNRIAYNQPLALSVPHDFDSSLSDYTCETEGDEFRIPVRQQHDKLRRFLCGTSPSSSVVISMYGTVEGVDVASRKNWLVSQGASPTKAAVDDACFVTNGNRSAAILGHGRDNQQLSLININTHSNMVSGTDLQRPWNPVKKGGVSAVAPLMQPLMFASGGYDHGVHLWTVKDDLSSASPETLNIKHNSQVQSLLAIHDTSSKLVSAGADCSVHVWDLSAERVAHTLKTSNSVYHAHPTTSPFCTLLEIAHRELQFEVRDHRVVPTIPVQRFGYTTLQVHGRFMKGSSLSNCFASGDRGGSVRLWDLRNVDKPCAQVACFTGQKIAHLVFQSSRLLACSENNQIRLVKYARPI